MEAISEIVEECIRYHMSQGFLAEIISRVEHLEGMQAKANKERDDLTQEVSKLKEANVNLARENTELKTEIVQLSEIVDKNEQYSRKDMLILSGDGLPPVSPNSGEHEDPSITRDIVTKVIRDKLGVELKGGITACHRLRKNSRALVKFGDLDDRQQVYEARFTSKDSDQSARIIIHENLTAKRAAQVRILSQLKDNKQIGSYHTRNGNIFARKSVEQKFVPITPFMSMDEILEATSQAANRAQRGSQWPHRVSGEHSSETQVKRFMRSQSFSSIPTGHVAERRCDLEEFVVPSRRGRRRGEGPHPTTSNSH